jgi:hypothetical protein
LVQFPGALEFGLVPAEEAVVFFFAVLAQRGGAFVEEVGFGLGDPLELPGEEGDAVGEEFFDRGLGVEVGVEGLGEGGEGFAFVGGDEGLGGEGGGGEAVRGGVLGGAEFAFLGAGAGGFPGVGAVGGETFFGDVCLVPFGKLRAGSGQWCVVSRRCPDCCDLIGGGHGVPSFGLWGGTRDAYFFLLLKKSFGVSCTAVPEGRVCPVALNLPLRGSPPLPSATPTARNPTAGAPPASREMGDGGPSWAGGSSRSL